MYNNINIIEQNEDNIVFEMKNTVPEVANKLRKTILDDVPTMAIHFIDNFVNTSVMHDDELRQRLYLIPIKADPELFEDFDEDEFTENNHIVFKINVECTQDEMIVMSSDIVWFPIKSQKKIFPKGFKPYHDNIPIIKLKKDQVLKCDLKCIKGTGKEHAKWCPVGTIVMRLMPKIVIKEETKGEEENKNICPRNVFDIEDSELIVKNPLNCTNCGNCIDIADVSYKKNHYIFISESVGQLEQYDVLNKALTLLR